MKATILALAATSIFAVASANAQNQEGEQAPEAVGDTSQVNLPANIKVGPPDRNANIPLTDEGNQVAKELAKHEGISVGEATKRLRLMRNASRIAQRLEKSDPDTFAGAATTRNGKLVVRFAGQGDQASRMNRVKGAGLDGDLAGDVETVEVKRSLKELRETVRAAAAQQKASGLRFDIGLDKASNTVKLLTQEPDKVRAAIAAGTIKVPDYVTVEQADPIVVTADVNGGRAYNNGSTYGCTTGFVVVRATDQKRGVTSAGHCEDPYTSEKYNNTLSVTSLSATSNISLTHQRSWAEGSGMDIGWYTVSTTHALPPVFWNGSANVTVRDVSYTWAATGSASSVGAPATPAAMPTTT